MSERKRFLKDTARDSAMTIQNNAPAGSGEAGVLYLCVGTRGNLLRNSVASLQRTIPELPLSILADRPYDLPFQWVDSRAGMASRHIKTQLHKHSPFGLTLYVDDDTVFARPVDPKAMLGEADLAVAPDLLPDLAQAGARLVRWAHHVSRKEVDETIALCGSDAPFYNTGVMVWQDNHATRQFFDRWHEEWRKHRKCDQFAFVRALKAIPLRLKVLDRTYNSPVYDRTCDPQAHIHHLLQKEWVARRFKLWKPSAPGPFEGAFQKAAEKGLMTAEQYGQIARTIHSNRPCSLLVIGAGHDADLWHHCAGDDIAFVEDKAEYASLCPRPPVMFTFPGKVGEWRDVPDPPAEIDRPWDYVIVDGPHGMTGRCPGRQIPIAWAVKLARKSVFVHDYDREWERKVCGRYLGSASEVVEAQERSDRKLAVFHRNERTADLSANRNRSRSESELEKIPPPSPPEPIGVPHLPASVTSSFENGSSNRILPTHSDNHGGTGAKDRLGILFLHHHTDPVVLNNLESIRRHNPGSTVTTISPGKALPGGYSMDATPELLGLHSTQSQRSSDRLVCSWYLQRREQCDKWWIVEWDTFCTTSVRKYYAPVWHYPFVASSVCLSHRQPDWYWFRHVKHMSEEYRCHATGAVPFLYLVEATALSAICTMLIEHPLSVGNGELRFATAARRCGLGPCGFSPPDDRITWMEVRPDTIQPGIFHSVKHMVPLPAGQARPASANNPTG